MEYPGSIVTFRVRRAIFFIFLAAFFIITPIIIMYTEGYRYDWQNWQRGLFKETGAISIDVLPKNAIVYLNDTKLNNKMPIRLKNVAPQKYNIKITASGYYYWTKEIEVQSKQTVYIKEISLLKKNDPTLLIEGDINQIFMSPDQKNMIYTVMKEKKVEIWMRNIHTGTNEKFFEWPAKEDLKINWSENSEYIAISKEQSPFDKLLIINRDNLNNQIDLTKKIKYTVDKYSWKESTEPELFFSTKLKIMSYLPATDRVLNLSKNNFLDWYMENGQLWTLQTDTSTNQYIIMRDTLGFNSIFKILGQNTDNNVNLKLLTAKNNNVLLKKVDSSEMLLITNDKTYNIAGEKYIISKYNNWWLIWTPWELWSYTTGEEPLLLSRSGEQLQNVLPLDKYNTLGLQLANKTTVLFPYYYVIHDMLDFSVNSIFSDSENRILYFTSKIKDKKGLWELKY